MDVWGLSLMLWSRYDVTTESGGFLIACWEDGDTEEGFSLWSSDLEQLVFRAKVHEMEYHS